SQMTATEIINQIKVLSGNYQTEVIFIYKPGDMGTVVEAFRAGAYDCLSWPVNTSELTAAIKRLDNQLDGSNNTSDLVKAFEHEATLNIPHPDYPHSENIGPGTLFCFSDIMKRIYGWARLYHADRSIPILIEGETGTGKELVARLIHYGLRSNDKPFIALNCAALSPALFESDLFGYQSGSFTGGVPGGQIGKFDLASGGTIVFDEISEIPIDLQAKLLRVIQEAEYYRVGGLKKFETDVRIIAISNRNLEKAVEQGTFRRDLYHRLNVGYIHIPPLRERREEIILLATRFLTQFAHDKGKNFIKISPEGAHILSSYDWPGNIRELKNVMQRVVLTADDREVRPFHLDFLRQEKSTWSITAEEVFDFHNIKLPSDSLPIEELYNHILLKALRMHNGNQTNTARYLGISRNSLIYRLKKIN
ncbi:MAG: sigma 54-interacting transcriptional regulator, partial [Chitinophagales bacterium]